MTGVRRVLVVSHSEVARDPRVRRQVEWLVTAGWAIDTLGLGDDAVPGAGRHNQVREEPWWLRTRLAKGLVHALLPPRVRFDLLMGTRMPLTAEAVRGYDLLLVNDVDWLPWAVRMARSTSGGSHRPRLLVDLHEWHPRGDERLGLVDRLLRGYHDWLVQHIGDKSIAARSTVADGLADLYAQRFQIDRPSVVRNSPELVELSPTDVDPRRIELVYHGSADLSRGLLLLAEAAELLESRYRLNFMLVEPKSGEVELRRRTAGLGDRVVFHEPVPMTEVTRRLNEWDLEVIFYPPTTPNFEFSLPNKFFEAVQARLAIVVGQSPAMAGLVTAHELGLVVDGWTASDLAAALNRLRPEEIVTMKAASMSAAAVLNSSEERSAFLDWVEGAS